MKKYSLDTNLEELNFSPELMKQFAQYQMTTIGDVTCFSQSFLKNMFDLSFDTLKDIKLTFANHGIVMADNPIYPYQLQEYILTKLEVDKIDLNNLNTELKWPMLDLKMWAWMALAPKELKKQMRDLDPMLTLRDIVKQKNFPDYSLKDFWHSLGYKFSDEEGFSKTMEHLQKSYEDSLFEYYDFSALKLPKEKTKGEVLRKYFDLTKRIADLQRKKKVLEQDLNLTNESIMVLEKEIDAIILEMETLQNGYDLR